MIVLLKKMIVLLYLTPIRRRHKKEILFIDQNEQIDKNIIESINSDEQTNFQFYSYQYH